MLPQSPVPCFAGCLNRLLQGRTSRRKEPGARPAEPAESS